MIDWNAVDTVFLDMDGTLLDLHFDNHFSREHVPLRYAAAQGLPLARARADLLVRYRRHEGTLAWYCVEHWSRELALDIAGLKQEVDHLIVMHPRIVDFLEALTALGKRRVLVTNAHPQSIALKLEKTPLASHLERIICSHALGTPKEADDFWPRVQTIERALRLPTLPLDRRQPAGAGDGEGLWFSLAAGGASTGFQGARPGAGRVSCYQALRGSVAEHGVLNRSRVLFTATISKRSAVRTF